MLLEIHTPSYLCARVVRGKRYTHTRVRAYGHACAVAFMPPLYRDVIKYLRTSEKGKKKMNQTLLMPHSIDLRNLDDSLIPSDLLVLRSILFFFSVRSLLLPSGSLNGYSRV